MKAQHYREMSLDELEGKLEELERHLFDLRSQAVTEKLENSKAGDHFDGGAPFYQALLSFPAVTHTGNKIYLFHKYPFAMVRYII